MTSFAALATACLVAAVAATLGSAPGWSDPDWSQRHHDPPPLPKEEEEGRSAWITFRGGRDGTTVLAGRLSLPVPASGAASTGNGTEPVPPPVVVLAQGLGLSHDCSLGPYVDAFAREGYAAFTFDYATFGASGSGVGNNAMPRHSVDPETHVSDLRAAVHAVRSRSDELGVDPDRMALWGTSLGGGHVLAAVADASASGGEGEGEDDGVPGLPGVRAVVSQVPHLASGLEGVLGTVSSDAMVYLPGLAKIAAGMVKAALLGLAGRPPWYLPLHGPPGSAAAMQNPGDDAGYGSLCSPGGGSFGWRNGLTAGSIPRVLLYRPLNRVSTIRKTTAVLMVAAGEDTLCPARWAVKAAGLIPNVEVAVLPGVGHFDVYSGKPLEEMLNLQVTFLRKQLGP